VQLTLGQVSPKRKLIQRCFDPGRLAVSLTL
jgi:hypothetical protein